MVCHSALQISFGTLVRDSALHYDLYMYSCCCWGGGGLRAISVSTILIPIALAGISNALSIDPQFEYVTRGANPITRSRLFADPPKVELSNKRNP